MSAGALPWRGRRLHFVGVGGAGMSGYARLARALGAEVSGSDQANTPFAKRLAADGVLRASIGHAVENLPAGGELEVIYSSAVPEDNVERRAARMAYTSIEAVVVLPWVPATATVRLRLVSSASSPARERSASPRSRAARRSTLSSGTAEE